MQRISSLVAVLAFAAFFAGSVSAQAVAPTKIGWIDTGAFGDEKGGGITKYINAYKALAAEVKPKETELIGLQTKLQTIAADLKRMQENTAVPIDRNAAAAKQDEGARLEREMKFKKEEYDAFVQKRGGEILGPINQDIGKAIADFGKQKGYIAIFDIEKLAQAGAILHLEPTANITKEFITFYNARPAGATAATVPR